jgi:hypothetical protein
MILEIFNFLRQDNTALRHEGAVRWDLQDSRMRLYSVQYANVCTWYMFLFIIEAPSIRPRDFHHFWNQCV